VTRHRSSLCICLGAVLTFVPLPASAQRRAEAEAERRNGFTTSRVEIYDGATPVLRAEREHRDDPVQRVGLLLPGRVVGMDGYLSVFLEDRVDRTGFGTAFEVGRGVPMLGGSIERDSVDYTGLYLKLRRPNAELGFGGGRRDGVWSSHGALYLKGARWSAAVGGARGPEGVDFGHFAATWHPRERGAGPGARLIAERRSSERYAAELMVADGANFNHFAVWGQFGMDQWPHRKTFEVLGDVMRYVRPPIFLHGYTLGRGVVTGRYELRGGVRELTLDARAFPTRFVRRAAPGAPDDARSGVSSYVVERVLPSIMVGGFRKLRAQTNTWVGEIAFPPFSVYGEAPADDRATPYLFLQYRQPLPF
jgi:hypothetical protein